MNKEVKEVNVYLFDESGRQINQWINLRKAETVYDSNKIKHVYMKTRDERTLLVMPAITNTIILEFIEENER